MQPALHLNQRPLEWARHVPILLLTAVTDDLVLQAARQVGAIDVVSKPIAAPEIGRRI